MGESGRAQSAPESQLLAERRAKLERLRESGVEPFPHAFEGRTEIAAVRAAHEGLAAGEETDDRYRVAGRIAARRGHGKAAFFDLVDGSGRIQLHAREDVLGAEAFERLVERRPRRHHRRRGNRRSRPSAASSRCGSSPGRCWPRACAHRPTSSTGSRTSRCATATASST